MQKDQYGRVSITESQAFELLYSSTNLELEKLHFIDPKQYNQAVKDLSLSWPRLKELDNISCSINEYDQMNQRKWKMPEDYFQLDIAKWLLDRCSNEEQLQRVGHELLLFCDRNMLDLLKYLKYLVEVMRTHSIVWGVGRGSSTASYVLYLLGVHKIDSIKYDLPIEEFLK